MSIRDFQVEISPVVAMEVIRKFITGTSITGKIVDSYSRSVDSQEIIVLIAEKFYVRSSRVTVSVTIDNLDSTTKVHLVGSGGGGLVPLDGGAGKSFVASIETALKPYILGGGKK